MTTNLSTYLQENTGDEFWWSLSPGQFDGSLARVWYVDSGYFYFGALSNVGGLRPAISLVSDVIVTGSGTSEDPYVVE